MKTKRNTYNKKCGRFVRIFYVTVRCESWNFINFSSIYANRCLFVYVPKKSQNNGLDYRLFLANDCKPAAVLSYVRADILKSRFLDDFAKFVFCVYGEANRLLVFFDAF